jgi:uncharacterized delta-60 repeat protein
MRAAVAANRSARNTALLASCAAVFATFLIGSQAATAAGKAGRLDRAFGKGGKTVTAFPEEKATRDYVNYALPFEFSPGRIAMAAAGGGKLVAANSRAIVAFLANGRRNPRFGGNGSVPIGPIEGSRFQLADVAVDSQGRVLIAGTTRPKTRFGMDNLALPGPIQSMATIRRYLPNGRLDPGFGSEGVLNTDLGAPRPTFEGQSYEGSAVAVVGLVVDGANRPIVTGSAVVEVGHCTPSQNRYEASQGIVARLTSSGGPDLSFAGKGMQLVGGLSWLGSPAPTSAGIFSAGTSSDPCPRGEDPVNPSVLVSLGKDGGLAPGFAASGFWSRPFTRISSLAVAPSGKIVLLVRTIELSRGEWIESPGEAVRLRANGSFDTGFGHGGSASLNLPKLGDVEAIAVDAKGRVVLAGQVWVKRGKNWYSKLLLMRRTAAGEPDREFGRRGRVATSFGARTKVRATDVLVDPAGRIVVGGKIVGPSIFNGFALVRYLSGR